MIPELRKRHRILWRVLSLPLFGGFLLALWSLPSPLVQPNLPVAQVHFDQVLQSADTTGFTLQLRSNEAGEKQLLVGVTAPLSVFSALVYSNDFLLGNLGAKGTHTFALDSLHAAAPLQVTIRNGLDQSILYQTTLK